jgi:glucose 1-dehydrogenase
MEDLSMPGNASRPLEGQIALVTGGSSGIGAGVAVALAAAGAAVGVNYASSAEGAAAVVDE